MHLILITKNDKPRDVMLNRRDVQLIEYARLQQNQQYIHKSHWLFINPRKKRILSLFFQQMGP